MSVTVHKLDTTDEFTDSNEFDIETLDDVTTQKGGAPSNNNSPGLSVPSNKTDAPSNITPINNNKPVSNMPANNMGNKPPSMNNLNKLPSMNNLNKPISNSQKVNNAPPTTEEEPDAESIEEPVTNTDGAAPISADTEEPIDEPSVKTSPKTKKAKPAGGKKGKKKAGLTKKKMVDADSATEPLNNDVKPQVEIGNDRGTMTIKYASSKTMTPLYSAGKSNHMDLTPLRDAFQASYNTVLSMGQDELMALRREMLNTEFNELGADSLIHGLLHLLDDHDTKKLTLRMMLARGELKIGA